MNKETRKESIERYLLGQMSEQEKAKFHLQLMRDKSLQNEVEANRMLYKTLWKAKQSGEAKPQNSGLNWFWLLPVLFLLGGLYFWFPINHPTTKTPQSPENTITEKPEIIDDKIDSTSISPQTDKEIPVSKNPPKKESPEAPKKKETPPIKLEKEKEKPKPRLMAANFEVNSDLEIYVAGVRGKSFSLISPKQVDKFQAIDGTFVFSLEGTLERDDKYYADEATYFYLFSNKKEDYIEFNPIIEQTLELKSDQKNRYSFQWKQSFELPSGLYYYLVEGERSGLYLVGKFMVE